MLRSLQESLQSHLLYGDEDISDRLLCPQKGALDRRLAVYAEGYYWRLIDALQQGYPLLCEYLGEEVFIELCEAYITQTPSHFCSVGEFIRPFPQFLAANDEAVQPHIAELATLIGALNVTLEYVDIPPLKRDALAAIPVENWPSLCFKYHPSVRCLIFQWNTFALWKALVQKAELPEMKEERSHCMVWAQDLLPYANHMTPLQYAVYQTFQAGRCFADVCEVVYTHGIEGESEAAAWVANQLSTGLKHDLFSEAYLI